MPKRLTAATVAVAAGLCLLNYVLEGLDLSGTWSAVLAAAALSVANATLWPVLARLTLPISVVTLGLGSLVLVVLSIDDESVFDERMVRQMRRRTAVSADGEPDTVFVQIDGLSLDVLRRAVRSGDVAVHAS